MGRDGFSLLFRTVKNFTRMFKVKQINLKKEMTVAELVEKFRLSGVFGAGRMAKAAYLLEKMVKDKNCKVFFGLAGAMVPGGMRNIIIDMLENNWIDVFVTTGANLTHDLIEAIGYSHYQGKSDIDDSLLNKKQIDRIYDSYMPNKVYRGLEDFFDKIFDNLPKEMNIKEFLWEVGKKVKRKSIFKTCYKKKIPIFCPAIADSGIGLMIWGKLARGKKIKVDAFDDLKEILDIAWTAKKTGIFYVGGGVPKNYIQQAMQFTKGASYGVQIKTDRPEYGGSSGADLKEGISWGKIKKNAEFVDVVCDATIALPIICATLKNRLKHA